MVTFRSDSEDSADVFRRVKGIERFKGTSFHTSRWNYEATGGTSDGNLWKLRDKTVGIIGGPELWVLVKARTHYSYPS